MSAPASRRTATLVMTARPTALVTLVAFVAGLVMSDRADAAFAVPAGSPRRVHPLFVNVPDAPQNDLAQQRFEQAVRRFGLWPLEVVAIEAPRRPEVTEPLAAGVAAVGKLDFGRGLALLDEVASEVAASGGAGLDTRALADLYFHRAWAMARADFNPAHVPDPPARARAYEDLLRAALLAPERSINTVQFPAALVEDWRRAVAEGRERAQGRLATVVVRAAPEAFVTLDGGNPIRGPATFVGVTPGEHLVHVDEPTFAPWGATLTVGSDAPGPIELTIPERRALTLPDREAGARARRMGMEYALVAEPRPGLGGLSLSLRLIDTGGNLRDSAIAQIAGDDGALDAAVMRLDEQARRMALAGTAPGATPTPSATSSGQGTSGPFAPVGAPSGDGRDVPALPPAVLVAAPPEGPRLDRQPMAWARAHWPLVTAVGVMLAATVILSVGVAQDH